MPEIERIRATSPEQLWDTYVLGRRPVIAGAKEWFLAPPQAIAPLGPHGAVILMDPMKLLPAQRRSLADAIGGYAFTV